MGLWPVLCRPERKLLSLLQVRERREESHSLPCHSPHLQPTHTTWFLLLFLCFSHVLLGVPLNESDLNYLQDMVKANHPQIPIFFTVTETSHFDKPCNSFGRFNFVLCSVLEITRCLLFIIFSNSNHTPSLSPQGRLKLDLKKHTSSPYPTPKICI